MSAVPRPGGRISGEMALVNTLGHDLRSPLTAVRGAATLLLQSLDDMPPAQVRDLLAIIDRRVLEMSDRIEDIIAVCHLDAGDLAVYLEPVEPAAILRRAFDPERPWPRPVEVADAPDDLLVEADVDRSVQVLRALMGNAIRFSSPDGRIRVDTATAEGSVEFTVSDEGQGVPAAEREQVFERLRHGAGGGPGLGLYMARGLARAMGGDVTFAAGEDGGAKVSFRLRRSG